MLNNKPTPVAITSHRHLGKTLNLFAFDELVGSGMPIWLENGNTLKEVIVTYINKLQRLYGIKMVKTPIFGTKDLYSMSGHLEHYEENIFPSITLEHKEYILRPMTCPHHILLMKKQVLSHKSFPIAYGENAMLYRYEYSGGLLGLERVRSMELIDTHIFVTPSQIDEEIKKYCKLIFHVIRIFDIQLDSITFSARDPKNKEKFVDDDQLWLSSESQLEKIIKEVIEELPEKAQITYKKDIGGAAFYGPKIDFQIKTNNNKEITLSTIQLDFVLAKRFDLSYKDAEQADQYPVIIHLGIIGTLERFIAYLIERYQGKFPFWLAPIQIMIIPINNEEHKSTCVMLKNIFDKHNLRSQINLQEQRHNKKLFNAHEQKVPYAILIGNKEKETLEQIFYKKLDDTTNHQEYLQIFIEKLIKENTPDI